MLNFRFSNKYVNYVKYNKMKYDNQSRKYDKYLMFKKEENN